MLTLDLKPYARYVQLFGLVSLIIALIEIGGFIGLGQTDHDPLVRYTHLQFGFGISFAFSRILSSIGIWMRAFWGALLWIVSIIGETLLLILWPRSLAPSMTTLSVHLFSLTILLVLIFLIARQRAR